MYDVYQFFIQFLGIKSELAKAKKDKEDFKKKERQTYAKMFSS